MAEIVALGELLMDCIIENGRITQANPGGSPCNYLAAASKYGASCAYIGKVGDDAYGHVLESALKNAGVDCGGMVKDLKCRTTQAFVRLAANGEHHFSFNRDADVKLTDDEVDYALIDSCRIFHFAGSLSLTDEPCRTALHHAAEYAKRRGKLISFDPNIRLLAWKGDVDRARDELAWGVRIADIIKVSEDEADFLGVDPTGLLESTLLVMVTKGADGASLYTRKASVDIECPKVNVVDTTGAGDIFNGAAASRVMKLLNASTDSGLNDRQLIDDLTEEQLAGIGRFAVNAASYSTQRSGAIPSIPDIREIE